MSTKTVYVPHPEAHKASPDQFTQALHKAGITGPHVVKSTINESGVGTEFKVEYDPEEQPKLGDDGKPVEDSGPAKTDKTK